MKAGEAIVALLQDYGVRHVFGIPGTHSIELYRGLADSSIKHVLPRHEQGAGFMADGYARRTGQPGVCFVITGPGVTNISTAMAQAWSDSVPLLVISPINDLVKDVTSGNNLYQGRLHEIPDQTAVTAPFTAFSCMAETTDHLAELIHQAFNAFYSDRPQPVHIHVPLSLLVDTVDVNKDPWLLRAVGVPSATDSISDQQIAETVQRLQQAERPVIVAGGGCRHFGELITALSEKLPAPVVTSVSGRGAMSGSHPLCAGAQLASEAAQLLIAESDLLLAVGCELSETDFWKQPELPAQQVWINLDSAVPFSGVSNSSDSTTLVADARQLLPLLSSKLADPTRESLVASHARAKTVRDSTSAQLSPVERKHWRVLTEVIKRLPPQAVVTSDMTQLAYTACNYLPLQNTNSWFHPNGYGTLGYALPAAIGVALSDTEASLLAIVGDAGFQYTMAELAVAVEQGLPVVVLLWNNDALKQIADDMVNAGIEPNAVVQRNPDFAALVPAMGANYKRVAGLGDLGPSLQAAFELQQPIVLELLESSV